MYTEKEREAAGKQIITLAKFAAAKVTGATRTQNFIVIGKYRGFDLCATASMLDDQGSAIPYLYFKINGETRSNHCGHRDRCHAQHGHALERH